MTLFDDGELDELRDEVLGLLPDVMTVQRTTATTDDAGYPIERVLEVATLVPCRIDPIKAAAELVVAERESMRTEYRLSCQHGTDLQNGDRVVVEAGTFEVLSVDKALSSGLVLRATVVEVS
jgi:head-tail adaptor